MISRRWHGKGLTVGVLLLAAPVPFVLPSAAAQGGGTINIGEADVREREVALMKETKQRLAATARSLRKEAQEKPAAVDSAAYAAAYGAFQEELSRARKRVWWKKTPGVEIPEVPPPSSEGRAALGREVAEAQQQEEEALRQAARDEAELRIREEELRTQQEIAAEERAQTAAAFEQTAILSDIYDGGYYDPGYYGPAYPAAPFPPAHKPVVGFHGPPGQIGHRGKAGVIRPAPGKGLPGKGVPGKGVPGGIPSKPGRAAGTGPVKGQR